MHSFAPFFNLKISTKNRHHFFAIEKLNFRFFSFSYRILQFFLRNFYELFSGFRAKFQKRVTSVVFQSNLRKQIRKLPKILKFVKIIQYYSILFNRVLTPASPHPSPAHAGSADAGSASNRRIDGSTARPAATCRPLCLF